MLRFGNFERAYRRLAQLSTKDLENELGMYCKQPSDLQHELSQRPRKMLEIRKIPRDKTWCLGEISGERVNVEAEALEREINRARKGKSGFAKEELAEFKNKLVKMGKQVNDAQKQALANTDIYLTWDYIDVYIATSMRNKWEYEETYDFITAVFADQRLKQLSVRFFDPTQSICIHPRDKGLIEGLMLKRAKCAIYLAQESDTMGKDSELAATLAQGKTVIAYVPEYTIKDYSSKIAQFPLNFFKKRLLILDAEGVFEDQECMKKLVKFDKNFDKKIDSFLSELDRYRVEQPFSLWTKKEEEFKKASECFPVVCQILAIAECHNFNRRADVLKNRHPLAMQVDLLSGVANGVLVVRKPKDAAELLYRIMTNQMRFTCEHKNPAPGKTNRREGYTILQESVSKSAFRVITDNKRLTNSFWNLFS
jgi:hypothetical protein